MPGCSPLRRTGDRLQGFARMLNSGDSASNETLRSPTLQRGLEWVRTAPYLVGPGPRKCGNGVSRLRRPAKCRVQGVCSRQFQTCQCSRPAVPHDPGSRQTLRTRRTSRVQSSILPPARCLKRYLFHSEYPQCRKKIVTHVTDFPIFRGLPYFGRWPKGLASITRGQSELGWVIRSARQLIELPDPKKPTNSARSSRGLELRKR